MQGLFYGFVQPRTAAQTNAKAKIIPHAKQNMSRFIKFQQKAAAALSLPS